MKHIQFVETNLQIYGHLAKISELFTYFHNLILTLLF